MLQVQTPTHGYKKKIACLVRMHIGENRSTIFKLYKIEGKNTLAIGASSTIKNGEFIYICYVVTKFAASYI